MSASVQKAVPARITRGRSADRSGAAHVELRDLTQRFGSFTAVDNISLSIPAGSFFALLGPSGCGKTTTLRMIGGFQEPSSGAILLDGVDVTRQPPFKRSVNTVFQSYALFPHMSVFENVAFGLRRRGVPGPEIRGRVRSALELVALEGFDRRKPSQLSGGQRQRVALARALVNQPGVLLLDEPLGALDMKLRRQMQLELKKIQSEIGVTFVHVTHDQEEAMTMADTIAVMKDGRLQQVGHPTELYEAPRTAFVAGFLGVSNLMKGTVTSPDTVVLDQSGIAVRVSELPEGFRASDRVAVGVRPEKLTMFGTPDIEGMPNVITGSVAEVAYVGVASQYVLETIEGPLLVYRQNAVPRPLDLRIADSVSVAWPPDATFVVPIDDRGVATSEEDGLP